MQQIGQDGSNRFQRGPDLPSELPLEVIQSYKMMMLRTTTMTIGNGKMIMMVRMIDGPQLPQVRLN